MKQRSRSLLAVVALLATFAIPSAAVLAASPQFDTGTQIGSGNNPYVSDTGGSLEAIGDVYGNHALYGKLLAPTPVDIYSFVPSQDGEQTFSLLVPSTESSAAQPTLIMVDSTANTTDSGLQIPLPTTGGYHSVLVTATTAVVNEPVLMESFTQYASGHYKLSKGKTYYLIVLDQTGLTSSFTIKFGDGASWTAGDLFTHLGAWIRVKTDSYGGVTPFTFKPATFGALMFFVGFAVLMGIWLIEQIFSFLANRMKMAGYVLIKLQPYSRIFTWVGLFLTFIGGYTYLNKVGWVGIAFVLVVIYVLLAALQLVYSFTMSRKLAALEVTKQEATIPVTIRKWLYAYFFVSFLGFGSLVTFLSIFLARV